MTSKEILDAYLDHQRHLPSVESRFQPPFTARPARDLLASWGTYWSVHDANGLRVAGPGSRQEMEWLAGLANAVPMDGYDPNVLTEDKPHIQQCGRHIVRAFRTTGGAYMVEVDGKHGGTVTPAGSMFLCTLERDAEAFWTAGSLEEAFRAIALGIAGRWGVKDDR